MYPEWAQIGDVKSVMVGLVSALSSKALNGHSFFNGTVCVAKDELTQLFICKLPNFFEKVALRDDKIAHLSDCSFFYECASLGS